MILKWVIAGVLFVGDQPINSKLFALDPAEYKTAADCERIRADMQKQAAEAEVSIWLKCVEVDFKPPKPPIKPQRYIQGGNT
jgi:hypothetical protein